MKRILISACVLGACLTACNNEDFLSDQEIVNNGNAEVGAVVGANLVSNGMTIKINGDNAMTRLTANGWQGGDKLGLAWYNYGTGAITDKQDSLTWRNSGINTNNVKLYANHLFSVVPGTMNFTTQTDVYEGSYFAYYPYERLGAVAQKVIDINGAAQEGDFETERWNKSFWISAQDFIGIKAVNENSELVSPIAIAPIVNTLKAELKPDGKIVNSEVLKGLTITQLAINANGDNKKIFATKASLKPGYLPRVTKKPAENQAIDYAATYSDIINSENIKKYLSIDAGDKSNSIVTDVRNADYDLKEAREVRAFALPIQENVVYTEDDAPNAIVTVGRLDENKNVKYAIGAFTIDGKNSKLFVEGLQGILEKNTPASLKGVLYNIEDNTWNYIPFSGDRALNLNLDAFKVYSNDIQSVEQWNDLVKVYDALKAAGITNAVPEFNVTKPLTFTEEIKVPAIGAKLTASETGSVTIAADMVWPENLTAETSATVTVNSDVILSINSEVDATIVNNGIIEAGPLSSISTQASKKLTNNGRVIVEYGAYVYPAKSEEGVIAYAVQVTDGTVAEDEITRINTLIGTNANVQWANINMLILESLTLDLNAKASSTGDAGDRYEDSTVELHNLTADMKDINIELIGGASIISTGENKKVNNIVNKLGENSIKDIEPNGNITVEAGILNINTAESPNSKNLYLAYGAKITTNGGELKVNTNTYATSIVNNANSKITVALGKTLYYQGDQFTHEGTTTGKIESMSNTNASAVMSAFEAVQASQHYKDALTFIDNVNQNRGKGNLHDNFYKAYNAWLTSIGESAKEELTVKDLYFYAQMTGKSFTWAE